MQNTDKFQYNDCENQYQKLFCDEHTKAKCFDMLVASFYDKNFGTSNKADTELLMFSLYMDAFIEKCSDENNILDYKKCSDYEIGKMLGIPQERVRTLKLKKQARYPENFDWKKSLLKVKNMSAMMIGKRKL